VKKPINREATIKEDVRIIIENNITGLHWYIKERIISEAKPL